MERSPGMTSMSDLTPSDLASLRLAAQVMSHRALLAGMPAASLYFDSLATSVDGEQAARAQAGPNVTSAGAATVAPVLIETARGEDDRRVIGEYLALLATNERLPASVRELCRALEAPFRQ